MNYNMDLKNWVKSNLKKGVSPEYLKQELKNKNCTLELVDKVQEELLEEKIKELSYSRKNSFQKKMLFLVSVFVISVFIFYYYSNTTSDFQEIKMYSLEHLSNMSKKMEDSNEDMSRRLFQESEYWNIEETCIENSIFLKSYDFDRSKPVTKCGDNCSLSIIKDSVTLCRFPGFCTKFNKSDLSDIKYCVKYAATDFLISNRFNVYMMHIFDSLLIVINQTKEEISKQESFKTCDEKSEFYSGLFNVMLCLREQSKGYTSFNNYMEIYEPQKEIYKLVENNYLNYTEKEVLEYFHKKSFFIYNNIIEEMCNYIIEEYPKVKQNKNRFLNNLTSLLQEGNLLGNKKLNIDTSSCLGETMDKTKKLNEKFINYRYVVLKDNCNNQNYDESVSDIMLLLGYIDSKRTN